MAPTQVTWRGDGIDTGRNVLAGADYLYDAAGGHTGFRFPPESSVSSINNLLVRRQSRTMERRLPTGTEPERGLLGAPRWHSWFSPGGAVPFWRANGSAKAVTCDDDGVAPCQKLVTEPGGLAGL
jgi:hypothetical protein